MQQYEFASVDRSDNVATVTIQRADKRNALNARVIDDLERAFRDLAESEIRAAVLTGAGKAFAAGADIAAMATATTMEAKAFADMGHALLAFMEALPYPVIAAVNGYALGGGLELALACDFIYASEDAKLGLPEVSLGIIPGFGGTQRLVRRVGAARAREMVLTADVLTAQQALDCGIVNAIFKNEELVPKAQDAAHRIAARAPLAVASAKRIMLRGESLDLVSACELEAQTFSALFGTEDQTTGMRAFLQKQKPAFSRR